mmetsp:Transcript_8564/g.20358  ORF Transcript_8564/g.20358 Transcript_8564/m.20358 type:complete len:411 (-) Transcript_8564:1484-2716(-)
MSTSDKPWAAPLRSTADSQERRLSKSQGKTSPNISSGRAFAKVPNAFAEVARTSGMGSTKVTLSCGISKGRYGWMSLASLMRSTIEPTICAPFRFMSADLSFMARWMSGHTRDKDAASIWWTKDVAKSLSSTSRVICSYCAPSVRALISSAAMFRSSGLLMMLPTLLMASLAASFTFACWSLMTVHKAGTTWGRQAASCLGKQLVMEARSSMEPNLVRHCLSSMPASSGLRTCFTPGPLSCDIIAPAATCEAFCTPRWESEKAWSSSGKLCTTYGSNSRPRFRVKPSKHSNAPSRTAALFLSSAAASILLRMECWEMDWMPIPFTVAPTPMAAPRRVVGSVLGASATSRSWSKVSAACSLFCFIKGGITFTMAFCTEVEEVLSCSLCSSRGKISGTLAWSAPKCLESAPK